MGIKLDWQVESEQTHTRATEDLATRQRRRRTQRQFALLIVGMVGVLGCIVIAVIWRLRDIDNRLRQDLEDTVQAEVTALRIGDFANYMTIQRSASDAFIHEQEQEYANYQLLKESNRIQLTGDIVDVEIDEQRGRVIVQEIRDGVPYNIVWYYWYYEDPGESNQPGWRHVPDDLTFWGKEREIETDHVKVNYRELDSSLAEALVERIETWVIEGCAQLNCASLPPQITVDIVAKDASPVEWGTSDYWAVSIASPLVQRSRADVAIDSDLETRLAGELAGRLVAFATNYTTPPTTADSAWFQAELARWLGARLRGASDNGFMESLIAISGPTAPQSALAALVLFNSNPTPPVLDDIMITFMGNSMPMLPIEQISALNWASFFQWRLALEHSLLTQPDQRFTFLGLYDQENLSTFNIATGRLEDAAYLAQPVPRVQSVTVSRDEFSQTNAYVEVGTTQDNTMTTTTIIWRLAGGTWKRLN